MLKHLNLENWENLKQPDKAKNYSASTINHADPAIYIFKDHHGMHHYAIKSDGKKSFKDPKINGVQIAVNQYNLNKTIIETFIDIKCNSSVYLEQFTYLMDQLTDNLLLNPQNTNETVNKIIGLNRVFWEKQRKIILSKEAQIGLICEMDVLKRIIDISPKVINNWTGPNGSKYDFMFTDYSFEVKGTRRDSHVHIINGLDQLDVTENNNLLLISYLAVETDTENSLSVDSFVSEISELLNNDLDILEKFNNLLYDSGYSPFDAEEYSKFEIYDPRSYLVDDDFPKLVRSMLSSTYSDRVSKIRYNVDLEGLKYKSLDKVNFGKYFY
jgi:hypothetical protein